MIECTLDMYTESVYNRNMIKGFADKETERRVLKDGASDFIKKPFDKEALISRVKKAIEELNTEK